MKRIATIFFFILVPLFATAQEKELFSIERTYFLAGQTEYNIKERSFRCLLEVEKKFPELTWIGGSRSETASVSFPFRDITINGHLYSIAYSFFIEITAHKEKYDVSLSNLLVTAYKGRRQLFAVQDIPVNEDTYYSGAFRYPKQRETIIEVSKEIKKIAAADFEYLLPSIREYMSGKR